MSDKTNPMVELFRAAIEPEYRKRVKQQGGRSDTRDNEDT
jgi:hypothetical protein